MIIYKDKIMNPKGMTLMEILVVIIVIGILASIAMPQINKAKEKSKQAEALPILANIQRGYKILVVDGLLDESSYVYNPPQRRRLTSQTSGTWDPDISGTDWDWQALEFAYNPNTDAKYFVFDFLPNGINAAQAAGGGCASNFNSFLPNTHNLALAVSQNQSGATDCTKYIYIDCQTGNITKSNFY